MFLCSCGPATQVTDRDANSRDLLYIQDYDSRLSQAKMRRLRSRYNSSAFGMSLLNASASPAYRFDPAFADSHKEFPNYFRKIRLINDSDGTVYAELLTHGTVEADLSLSVKKVVLPPNSFINLFTARDAEYNLNYTWKEDMSELRVLTFRPADNKIIHVKK
jgi:hypothetical protein